jgi:hypothetical protein
VCYDVWRVKQINFLLYVIFFMKLGGLGGLNEVCGIIYETRRYDTSIIVPSRILCINASVVLVQPVVVVVVILFRLRIRCNSVYCCM